jgi:uncharacterized protein YfaP (DUF2135 family)
MRRSVFCALLLLAACAKQPGDIVAASVPTDTYSQMTCESLVSQKAEKQAELDGLSSKQENTAKRDAAWMVIVHVPVASLSQGDNSKQIANLKGQLNAIDQSYQAKSCATQAQTTAQVKQ